MAGLEVIAHTELGSDAMSVEFTSIPGTYRHLLLKGSTRSARTNARYDGSSLTFNDDTGSNYSYTALFGSGGVPAGTEDLGRPNFNYAFDALAQSSASNGFSAGELWILDYASTDKFTGMIGGVSATNSALDASDYEQTLVHGHWKSTAAVTKIKVKSGLGDFKQYTTFTLYGLNSAD